MPDVLQVVWESLRLRLAVAPRPNAHGGRTAETPPPPPRKQTGASGRRLAANCLHWGADL
ncbi:Hypothetical protein SMAX5B_019156 [Scophthalmus maximus]|uniref:Uncharacterized protein n=1 Tax=Scophthalmus maximus TaxID=52904 RepID=A0A2U9C7R1_SCOMX|nr:Hypothetical protein SMAX5B_019156 [Scophthalmus maximus]